MQKLAHDLRSTLVPVYDTLLKCLFPLLARSISAEALTALLSTLSALFKYLLIPSTSDADSTIEAESGMLRTTWSQLLAILGKCNLEVQRATAETWAFVLRRLRQSARDRCVKLMLLEEGQSLDGVEDALAWMFQFATKVCPDTRHCMI